MTRRGQIEYSMRRYGVPLCVEGTQGVGFLRALNTKSGQEPEEYWCAVQAGLGLPGGRAGGVPRPPLPGGALGADVDGARGAI